MSSYRKLDERRNISLGEYATVQEEGDWEKGLKMALETVMVRNSLEKDLKQRAREIYEDVVENIKKFSGWSRPPIACAIVYKTLKEEGRECNMAKVGKTGSASRTSVKKAYKTIKKLED